MKEDRELNGELGMWNAETSYPRTGNRRQMAEYRGRKTENRRQMTEVGGLM